MGLLGRVGRKLAMDVEEGAKPLGKLLFPATSGAMAGGFAGNMVDYSVSPDDGGDHAGAILGASLGPALAGGFAAHRIVSAVASALKASAPHLTDELVLTKAHELIRSADTNPDAARFINELMSGQRVGSHNSGYSIWRGSAADGKDFGGLSNQGFRKNDPM